MTFPEPSSASDALGPGDTLGRYELLLPIAEGGMAMVWAARLMGTRGFSKTVAIKTMLPELSLDAHFERMFLDEARIASRIRHPNVAEILDLGEEGGRLYLVMEWVDGEPLANLRRDALKKGGMPLGVAVRIAAAACAGLHAAHELVDEHTQAQLGIVHRDISPQNLLVTFDGMVKIVDFGVAKSAGRSIDETSAGHVKGKPPYMSPEQASGLDVDRRTDLFALGIVLYQLVTGKHPFRGESDLVTLQNIISDKPVVAPRAHNHECPKILERVILRAVQRDPEARYSSALEFEQALDDAMRELPATGRHDVAQFVRSVAGERGARRRRQLQDASFAAEERSGQAPVPSRSSGGPRLSLGNVIGPLGRISRSERRTKSDEVTPVAAPPRRRSRLGWVLLAASGVALSGFFLAFTRVNESPLSERGGLAEDPPRSAAPIAMSAAVTHSAEPARSDRIVEVTRVPSVTESVTVTRADARLTATPSETSVPKRAPRSGPRPAEREVAAPEVPPAAPAEDRGRGRASPNLAGGRSGFAPPPVENPGF